MVIARRAHARSLLVSTAPSLLAPKKKTKKKAVKADAASTRANASIEATSTTKHDQDEAPESESSRLREQLLHVLVDHQRQEEEIIALRALARSLKEEVELIHKQQQTQTHSRAISHTKPANTYGDDKKRPHEFFKLDLQLEQLRSENSQIRHELHDANEELESLRVFVNYELPQFKIAVVQAKAELECVKSQLHDERAHCDRLEAQVAHYRARSSASVSSASSSLRKHPEHERNTKLESHREQAVHAARDTRRREREQFLLQCRLSAVANDDDDDKENSESGNHGDGPSGGVDELSETSRRRSIGSPSMASSNRSSSSSKNSSQATSLSSRVHRDLSVLDRELQALQTALT